MAPTQDVELYTGTAHLTRRRYGHSFPLGIFSTLEELESVIEWHRTEKRGMYEYETHKFTVGEVYGLDEALVDFDLGER